MQQLFTIAWFFTLLFTYMCMRLPLSPKSIAGVLQTGATASRLPYYCIPPVTVPDVIGVLAAWWHNTNKKNNQEFRVPIRIIVTPRH